LVCSVNDYVGWLDVLVDQAGEVNLSQCRDYANSKLQKTSGREGFAQDRGEGKATRIGENQDGPIIVEFQSKRSGSPSGFELGSKSMLIF
jgi:hypothetical protein